MFSLTAVMGELRSMAAAVSALQQAAVSVVCDAEHVQTEPRAAGDSVGWQTRDRITLVQSTWPSRSRTARTS